MLVDLIRSWFHKSTPKEVPKKDPIGRRLYTSAAFDESKFILVEANELNQHHKSSYLPVFKSGSILMLREVSVSKQMAEEAGYQCSTSWSLESNGYTVVASVSDATTKMMYKRQYASGRDTYTYERFERGHKCVSLERSSPFSSQNESEVMELAGEFLVGRNFKIDSIYKADISSVVKSVRFHEEMFKLPFCGDIDVNDVHAVFKALQEYMIRYGVRTGIGIIQDATRNGKTNVDRWSKILKWVCEHTQIDQAKAYKAMCLADICFVGKSIPLYMTNVGTGQLSSILELYKIQFVMSN